MPKKTPEEELAEYQMFPIEVRRRASKMRELMHKHAWFSDEPYKIKQSPWTKCPMFLRIHFCKQVIAAAEADKIVTSYEATLDEDGKPPVKEEKPKPTLRRLS